MASPFADALDLAAQHEERVSKVAALEGTVKELKATIALRKARETSELAAIAATFAKVKETASGALKAGGIHDQFTCDFGALTKAAIELQGLCHGISDTHAKVTGSTDEPGSSAWRLGLAARARSALDSYDEIVAGIVSNLEDVDSLVTKLPHLAELHGDQVQRLLRWRERLARLSNVLAGHVAESSLQSETLVACKAKVVRVTAKTVGTVRKADDVQSQLGALKTKRAQEAQDCSDATIVLRSEVEQLGVKNDALRSFNAAQNARLVAIRKAIVVAQGKLCAIREATTCASQEESRLRGLVLDCDAAREAETEAKVKCTLRLDAARATIPPRKDIEVNEAEAVRVLDELVQKRDTAATQLVLQHRSVGTAAAHVSDLLRALSTAVARAVVLPDSNSLAGGFSLSHEQFCQLSHGSGFDAGSPDAARAVVAKAAREVMRACLDPQPTALVFAKAELRTDLTAPELQEAVRLGRPAFETAETLPLASCEAVNSEQLMLPAGGEGDGSLVLYVSEGGSTGLFLPGAVAATGSPAGAAGGGAAPEPLHASPSVDELQASIQLLQRVLDTAPSLVTAANACESTLQDSLGSLRESAAETDGLRQQLAALTAEAASAKGSRDAAAERASLAGSALAKETADAKTQLTSLKAVGDATYESAERDARAEFSRLATELDAEAQAGAAAVEKQQHDIALEKLRVSEARQEQARGSASLAAAQADVGRRHSLLRDAEQFHASHAGRNLQPEPEAANRSGMEDQPSLGGRKRKPAATEDSASLQLRVGGSGARRQRGEGPGFAVAPLMAPALTRSIAHDMMHAPAMDSALPLQRRLTAGAAPPSRLRAPVYEDEDEDSDDAADEYRPVAAEVRRQSARAGSGGRPPTSPVADVAGLGDGSPLSDTGGDPRASEGLRRRPWPPALPVRSSLGGRAAGGDADDDEGFDGSGDLPDGRIHALHHPQLAGRPSRNPVEPTASSRPQSEQQPRVPPKSASRHTPLQRLLPQATTTPATTFAQVSALAQSGSGSSGFGPPRGYGAGPQGSLWSSNAGWEGQLAAAATAAPAATFQTPVIRRPATSSATSSLASIRPPSGTSCSAHAVTRGGGGGGGGGGSAAAGARSLGGTSVMVSRMPMHVQHSAAAPAAGIGFDFDDFSDDGEGQPPPPPPPKKAPAAASGAGQSKAGRR